MKTQTLILIFIVLSIVIYFIWTKLMNQKTKPDTDTSRPSDEYLPKQEIPNDKFVISNNITSIEIDSILTGFCNMYNKKTYQAMPRLYKLNDKQFAITFPYDIEFDIFCYFVNYIHYPMEFEKSFEATGWTTTTRGQIWITEKSADKKVMLFILTDDTEYDNVYMTTNDNIGYRLGFASGEEKQLLDSPKKQFVKPQIEIEGLANTEYKDYK